MKKLITVAILGALGAGTAQADIIHADDVIINGGSLCAGQDCVNGENFGFDTLRLKENNLRIHFDDTSNSASFPGVDWRIVANDTSNGGENRFSIEDATGSQTPFTILAGADNHSLYVDASGQIGFGTNTPVVEMHSVDGDTPTMRLEQDGSSGFGQQTWDLAGNETNFFLRDVTNGSKLPFRIRPDAPTSSLDIAADGDVGMGTQSPSTALHVNRVDTAKVLVQNTTGTEGTRELFELTNNGNVKFLLTNTKAGMTQSWGFTNNGNDFRVSKQGSGNVEMKLFSNGDMEIAGALTQNSDRAAKTAIESLDQADVLAQILNLPITQWEYKDAPGVKHIGPMAQDFHAAFGLGKNERGISSVDTAGVALAAIQALAKDNAEKVGEIEQLKTAHRETLAAWHRQNDELKAMQSELSELQDARARLVALEAVVAELAAGQATPVLTSVK